MHRRKGAAGTAVVSTHTQSLCHVIALFAKEQRSRYYIGNETKIKRDNLDVDLGGIYTELLN